MSNYDDDSSFEDDYFELTEQDRDELSNKIIHGLPRVEHNTSKRNTVNPITLDGTLEVELYQPVMIHDTRKEERLMIYIKYRGIKFNVNDDNIWIEIDYDDKNGNGSMIQNCKYPELQYGIKTSRLRLL
jgi:hypothetical protein